MIKYLLATTSLFASCAAHAQTEQTPPAQGESGVGIAEIVVTASRREESVQKSALSIQAISTEALSRAGVTRPEDLSAIAPGVSIATGGNVPQTYIRGVGNYSTNNYAEGAVAYNIDGVYVSRGWATRGSFFDLDRVEVLKGPQGTLYGRNASGGAINIITGKPRLGERSGHVEMEAGNYDLMRGEAAVNLPIGETLALRAAGQVTTRDGYLSDGSDDEKSQSARLRLLWEPSQDVSLLINGGYQHLGGRGSGAVINPPLPGSPWRAASDPAVTAIFRAQPGIGAFLNVPATDGFLNIDVYSIGAELNWDFGPAKLTLLPAYRDAKIRDRSYLPGFKVEDSEHDKQTSFEARLSNESDRLKWVLGAYYFNEDQANLPGRDVLFVDQGITIQRNMEGFRSRIRSYAGFGQATFSLTDALRLTGGLRYTYERKTQNGTFFSAGFPFFIPAIVPVVEELSYKSWTYKAGFEFDLAPRSMLYGTVSTGFKSGGFFLGPSPNTFRPEKLTAFELGVKNRFFDNRLQVNLEAFYWRYRDHQESHVGPTSIPGVFSFITENAGRAKSYGADLDVVFMPTPNDNFSVKVQYNKSEYDTFTYNFPSGALHAPANTGCATSLANPGGPVDPGQTTIIDCAGFQLVRAPTWSGTVSYDHTFDFANGAKVVAGVRTQFASSSFLSIDFLPSAKQDAYATFDADLSYTTPDGRMTITGYVRNITEEVVYTQAFVSPFIAPRPINPLAGPDGLVFTTIRPPRTYGARLRLNF
jgi:iron complex outermembrane receptor protein